MKKINSTLVPELVKNIAHRANPSNVHTNEQEKGVAVAQLENIVAFCEQVLSDLKRKSGNRA